MRLLQKPMRSLINTLTDLIPYLVCSCPISSCLSEKTTEAKYKSFVGQMSFICMGMKKKSFQDQWLRT